jgi:hypothetical protein
MNRKLSFIRAAAAMSLQAAALAFTSGASSADELGAFLAPQPASQLELAFWDCERAAARGMSLDDGLLCAEISEEFKRERFGGDFDALLAYWTARKPFEVLPQPIEVAGSDMVP